MSGSRYQSTGAVFGDGVYLSDKASVACSFAPVGGLWPGSAVCGKVRMVAVAEVLMSHPGVKKVTDAGEETAVTAASHVRQGGGDDDAAAAAAAPPVSGGGASGAYIIAPEEAVRVKYLLLYADSPGGHGRTQPSGGGQAAAGRLLSCCGLCGSAGVSGMAFCTALMVVYAAALLAAGLGWTPSLAMAMLLRW
jgi:hypothetical protein